MWKKIYVTLNLASTSTSPVLIQGQDWEDLLHNAVSRLSLHTEVSHFTDGNGKKINNFENVPIFKDSKEMSSRIFEVQYKFKNSAIKSRADLIKSEKEDKETTKSVTTVPTTAADQSVNHDDEET